MEQYLGVSIFFGLLMMIAWITSCHWAKKYNELRKQIDDGEYIRIDKIS